MKFKLKIKKERKKSINLLKKETEIKLKVLI